MNKLIVVLLALLAAAHPVSAQEHPPYSQAELDQMLAPIALYPDALLSQVLMAATYPIEVVEAARWSRAHPGLQGDEAAAMVADEFWDPSVKSLAAFPTLLQRMDENLAWTRRLGQAFLQQEPHVMETVQRLRRRAAAAGHLLPDERLRVVADGSTLVIEQADPRVVVVPYYDPWVVYGAWGWPAYPPIAWSPWPRVVIGVTAGFFFGGIDWHHRHVKVVHAHSHYLRSRHPRRAYRPIHVGKWQHAPRQPHRARRPDQRPAHFVPRVRPMPPALSASPQPQPRPVARPRIIRSHDRSRVAVDPAHRVGGVRANPAQHRAAQPHRFAGHPRRDARPVPVRPAVRAGVAGDRPRLAR